MNFRSSDHLKKIAENCRIITIVTSMMWPSQNFLLYNGAVIKIQVYEWINNLKKYVMSVPPLGNTYLYKL